MVKGFTHNRVFVHSIVAPCMKSDPYSLLTHTQYGSDFMQGAIVCKSFDFQTALKIDLSNK